MKPVQPMQTKAQNEAALKLALAKHHEGTPYATRLRQEAALLMGAVPRNSRIDRIVIHCSQCRRRGAQRPFYNR